MVHEGVQGGSSSNDTCHDCLALLGVQVGSLPELGAWVPEQGTALQWKPGHAWVVDLELPASAEVEMKVGLPCMEEAGGFLDHKRNMLLLQRTLLQTCHSVPITSTPSF